MTGHFDRNGTGDWHTHDERQACPIGPEPKDSEQSDEPDEPEKGVPVRAEPGSLGARLFGVYAGDEWPE